MKLQTSTDEETKMSLLLAIHCAPILLGIKAANIMTVTGREFFRIGDLLRDTGISYCFLKTKGDKGILYLYREQEIMKYLHSEDIQSFLKGYGYETENFQEMLERLSKRIHIYSNGEEEFPHEIGVFLEYPLIDVKGFVDNDGKNFIYSGYWKVYADVNNTLRKFREYDLVREHAIQAVVSGKKIREIAV
ncbi:MAG: DUF3793 family protein [Lachnospiraceae bacterium]|nr:DUF3793 family protein [Lachnospiraceae bacterium]